MFILNVYIKKFLCCYIEDIFYLYFDAYLESYILKLLKSTLVILNGYKVQNNLTQ